MPRRTNWGVEERAARLVARETRWQGRGEGTTTPLLPAPNGPHAAASEARRALYYLLLRGYATRLPDGRYRATGAGVAWAAWVRGHDGAGDANTKTEPRGDAA